MIPAVQPTANPTRGTVNDQEVQKTTTTAKLIDNTNGLFPPVIITIPPPVSTKATPKIEPSPTPAETEPKASPTPTPIPKTGENSLTPNPETTAQNRPVPPNGRARVVDGAEVKPCTLTLDQETIAVQSGGNDRAVVVRRVDDGDIDGLTASSSSPQDLSVRREPIPGVKWTALFVLRSTSLKPGVFQIKFEAPCGKKEVSVRVQ